VKSAEEIMNMLEAFGLTGSLRDAGELSGVSHHTVARYVAAREAGTLSERPAARARLIDEFLPKVEEWIERSKGKLRADRAHDKLLARSCCPARMPLAHPVDAKLRPSAPSHRKSRTPGVSLR